MAESRMRRAAQALRDPWSLLAAAVGAGAAWALELPIAGIGAVGVGMLGVAAVVGAIASGDRTTAEPVPALLAGTVQYRLVGTLESYLADLTRLQSGQPAGVLSSQAADAVDAARSARTVAVSVGSSIDALDAALGQAGQVARQMSALDKVAGPMERMLTRREQLLGKLTSAVDGVGELYTKLLELSATPDLTLSAQADHGPDPVAEVNDSARCHPRSIRRTRHGGANDFGQSQLAGEDPVAAARKRRGRRRCAQTRLDRNARTSAGPRGDRCRTQPDVSRCGG